MRSIPAGYEEDAARRALEPWESTGATLAPGAHLSRAQVPGSAGVVVGLQLRCVCVFKPFAWLEVGPIKSALKIGWISTDVLMQLLRVKNDNGIKTGWNATPEASTMNSKKERKINSIRKTRNHFEKVYESKTTISSIYSSFIGDYVTGCL